MKKLGLLLVCVLLFTAFSSAQQAQMFEPSLISNGGVFGLTISPDGRRALWVESGGSREKLVIMESVFIKGKWNKPQIAAFSGKEGWRDIDPMFSPDGKTLLFQSTRPVANHPNRKGFDIWAVKFDGKNWSAPFHLGDTINTDASESYASMTGRGDIYFMKENPDGIGKSDIWVAEFIKGKYQPPNNLGALINTSERESNPFISPDGDYLIYFSTDPEGFGETDLYITFRRDGQWTTPQNLGKIVNTENAEFCPFYHKKQDRLYFSRQKKKGDKFIEDLYYVSNFSKSLKEMKAKSATVK